MVGADSMTEIGAVVGWGGALIRTFGVTAAGQTVAAGRVVRCLAPWAFRLVDSLYSQGRLD
jgi:hypothetical protein